jgi:UDP-N-acetylmuramoyl-tripeptide--D-alanyl-D-alanine ligase
MMKPRPAKHFFKAMETGLKDGVLRPAKRRAKLELARGYRSFLQAFGNARFVGVTGSCGKTTTTELIAAVLAGEAPVRMRSDLNTTEYIAEAILTVPPRRRCFCVTEISGHAPGAVQAAVRLLRPQIGVVTNVGQDHYANYRDVELTAAEKGRLVEALPARGFAVLNADDPRVRATGERTGARVITYGLSPEAMVRGRNVTCAWPQALALEVCCAGETYHVQTQLLGRHWAYAVLAAAAVGMAVGISPQRALRAAEAFEPVFGRMSPHRAPGGATFIYDGVKAPLWAIPACLDFMRAARANRKVLVIGSISDTPRSSYRRSQAVIRQALGAVDKIIFVGAHASAARRARPRDGDDRVMVFDTLYELDRFLAGYLKEGDLVLLKGSRAADHLDRILLSQTDDVQCWRECKRRRFCRGCRLQYAPFVPTPPAGGGGRRPSTA